MQAGECLPIHFTAWILFLNEFGFFLNKMTLVFDIEISYEMNATFVCIHLQFIENLEGSLCFMSVNAVTINNNRSQVDSGSILACSICLDYVCSMVAVI